MPWNQFIGVTMLLFALTNPVGAIPIFLQLTRQTRNTKVHEIIIIAAASVAIFLIGSVLLGKSILNFFNVGLDDFRIAGGLLALFIAFEMFQARYGKLIRPVGATSGREMDVRGVAITPFAFPLLVGPAEMSIMITLANDNSSWVGKALLTAASLIATFFMGLTLWLSTPISRLLGNTGINVVTRVMALIVAAIGVNFIMTGIRSELWGLASQVSHTG